MRSALESTVNSTRQSPVRMRYAPLSDRRNGFALLTGRNEICPGLLERDRFHACTFFRLMARPNVCLTVGAETASSFARKSEDQSLSISPQMAYESAARGPNRSAAVIGKLACERTSISLSNAVAFWTRSAQRTSARKSNCLSTSISGKSSKTEKAQSVFRSRPASIIATRR